MIPAGYCPVFAKQVVQSNRIDGYWIETFPEHTKLDLIGYGLGSQVINYYHNPLDPKSKNEWKRTEIQKLPSPVGMDKCDLRGTGFNDIFICTDYGATMVHCDPNGGNIYWLENPGLTSDGKIPEVQHWNKHFIGRSTAMHRMRIGHFTRTDKWQLLAMPIVREPENLTGPVPVHIFTEPDNLFEAEQWDALLVDDGYYHIIHDARVLDFGPSGPTTLNTVIIASQEGLTWTWWDDHDQEFKKLLINAGELTETLQTSWSGTGGVDIGKIGGRLSYIAACEPFHGNTIAVYVPQHGEYSKPWKRFVLDVFGPPDTHGEGPIHYVVCADFDGDGNDEFLAALRGPFPYQGVYYYKPVDLVSGKFERWQVSQDSAARIAIGDFDQDGYLDFATIAYNVPGYFEAPDPAVNIYYNRFTELFVKNKLSEIVQVPEAGTPISVKVPRPTTTLKYLTYHIAEIGGVDVWLEVLPSNSSRVVDKLVRGVKVLYGHIAWNDKKSGLAQTRAHTVDPRTVASVAVDPDDGRIHTNQDGAVIVTFRTKNMHQLHYPSIDSIKIGFHCAGANWKKVDSLDWGAKFKGLEFYNLEGIKIGFLEDLQHLAYIQFWAAGINVNCGIHNHLTDHFSEVHTCMVNGTGGGMEYSPNPYLQPEQITPEQEAHFIKLKVPSFHEHGPLWLISKENQPVSRQDGTTRYPVHKWQSLDNGGKPGQSFDTWVAFELLPLLASTGPVVPPLVHI